MMARRHVAFGLTLVFCLALGDAMNAWAETAEGEWKTYRNSTYQFSIGYPAKLLEPLEGDARFFFRSSHAPVWLRLCFAPIPRTDFYCEVELYVVPKAMLQGQVTSDEFLGSCRCGEEGILA